MTCPGLALKLPGHRKTGIRSVRTESAGFDRRREITFKSEVLLGGLLDDGFDCAGYVHARPFGMRGRFAVAAVQSNYVGELLGQSFDFLVQTVGALRVVELLRFFQSLT